jgi:hypothetical protein
MIQFAKSPELSGIFPLSCFLSLSLFVARPAAAMCKGVTDVVNRNANLSVRVYPNPNARLLHLYQGNLPTSFPKFLEKSGVKWCDSGAGWGLAGIEFSTKRPDARVTVINAQDNWSFFRELPIDDAYFESLKGPLFRTYFALSLNTEEMVHYHEHLGPIYQKNWQETAKTSIFSALKGIEASGRFRYKVGMTEKVLERDPTYDVISDFFGAFYYSTDRLTLLNRYYSSLEEGGISYTVLRATDFPVDEEPRQHGPENTIRDGDKSISLEEFLVELYPNIFSVETAGNNGPNGILTKVLVIRRIPSIKALDLHSQLEVLSSHFQTEGNVPNLVLKFKK